MEWYTICGKETYRRNRDPSISSQNSQGNAGPHPISHLNPEENHGKIRTRSPLVVASACGKWHFVCTNVIKIPMGSSSLPYASIILFSWKEKEKKKNISCKFYQKLRAISKDWSSLSETTSNMRLLQGKCFYGWWAGMPFHHPTRVKSISSIAFPIFIITNLI